MVLPSAQTLTIECPDQRGLINLVTGILASNGANILSNDEFVDQERGRFFMRTEFVGASAPHDLVPELQRLLPQPSVVRLFEPGALRIVVMASREHHCLSELLIRHEYGELGARIVAVVSNHDTLRGLADRFAVPFHHVPHEGRSRDAHEREVLATLDRYSPDYVVLAKYMRVLTPAFVTRYAGRMINIHHSFLPAFVGAHPYRQAFDRGVKIIGATAHFVTDELDEGPIIAQSVVPVDHTHGALQMARAGRDVEKLVLATALTLVFENRVFINARRTVVFS